MVTIDEEMTRLVANTVRFLAVDGVQRANSGHPGMPLGMADAATVLWSYFLKYNPQQPQWIARDRFILSAGHGSMLLYSLLHLSGYAVTIDDLKQFRQWNSHTPGHPEYRCLPGVEMTTGPLGQGFATGVGLALAAKMTAARFNTPDFQLFGTHKIYAIVSDGDLMEGVSSEAASLAGHLNLDNLIYLYDDNKITIEGKTNLAFSESVAERFAAYGWAILEADGHDYQAVAQVLERAQNMGRPTLIITKTHIGYGSPNKQDQAECHGAPLGVEEVAITKRNLGWQAPHDFYVPEEVYAFFQERARYQEENYRSWQAQFEKWQKANPELALNWGKWQHQELTAEMEQSILSAVTAEAGATRALSGKLMQKIAELLPGLCGGSADLSPSTNTFLKAYSAVQKDDYIGRNLHFGIREHAMGAILNGMALYGGFIPFGSTFLTFADYMRPAIRLAAMMHLQVIFIFTHDSIFVGEDGPTHQPIEQIPSLRIIPNLTVIRPADAIEIAYTWLMALRQKEGPTAILLTRQKVALVERDSDCDVENIFKGSYIVSKEKSVLKLVLIATGSEVSLAVMTKVALGEFAAHVRVVSMPAREVFVAQPAEYRESVIPSDATPKVVIETAYMSGWGDVIPAPLLQIGINRFGASAPEKVLAEKFGFTPQAVIEKIKEWKPELIG